MRPALITRRRLAAAVLAGFAALASPGSARAAFVADSTVNIKSTTPAYGAGSFTGTVSVDNVDATHSTVRISLTNTSAAPEFITALGFSLPNSLTAGAGNTALSMKPSASWQLLGASTNFVDNSAFDTGYFGRFDIGASIGSTWHTPAGTNPTSGIAQGQSGTFEFTLVGAGANVTAQALVNTYASTNGSIGIGVRFRNSGDVASALTGNVNGGKVLAVKDYTPTGGQVPAPPAVVLALAGVGCLLGRGAFRRKATAPATA